MPHNVTSEMGLALMDVADVIRPHPEVVAFLEHVEDEGFLDELPAHRRWEAREAIGAFLAPYGCAAPVRSTSRGHGGANIPSTLVPLLLDNVKNFEEGAAERRFEHGRREASKREQELLARGARLAGRGVQGR